MFGSGYNPWRAEGKARREEELSREPWGKPVVPLPAGINPEDLYVDGSFSMKLYEKLMEESGAAEKLLEARKEAARRMADLPLKKKELRWTHTDQYRRSYEVTDGFWVLDGINLSDAELVVLRRAQHKNKLGFREELYKSIKELTGVEISAHTGRR